ncbi:peptide/nickel transport system substrate-binding protein/oligopeptide transport system substrate-binding protein [Arboricoccus pini]|uniref:Peptide/nickel transport system substrate-binding protein/oligopeptide transport system substrate-binding protein n=1 Tax=Arboricoccus pini TaxID=1963835 RepID=A0A212RGR1_9PROT|nr:ABC transporter substrate-binding protein [Arboricoccus pini]SNB71588.1 peptide/nickel transport system substrate-binding protein/oligopeptide transport system substrate-binding protein [Arboricoccus pini]
MLKRWLRNGALALALLGGTALSAQAGGTLVITFKDDVTTLDPAIGYDWQNWSMIKSVFSRLMDYKPGTTELEPSLAENYEVAPDGKTFTFKIRPGVKFHNGREVVASDVKYSIERAVDPKTQGPGAGFFSSIEGFEDLTGGKSKELKGIEVVDDHTVRFHLSRPDATFLHVMAINFAGVVPKEEVEKWGADFGKHPVGSGPFIFKEWDLGQKLVFAKNPDYFIKGLPKLDGYEVEVGQEPVVALLRLQRGEVDLAGDGIPPAKFNDVMNDPAMSALVAKGQQLHTGYISLNVKMKPFDNLKVRQAIGMAINKERVLRVINNRATAANQPLPPAMPGYDKDYKGLAYDVAGAKKLLAEAGYPNGFETTLFVANTDPQPRIAQAVQQDLAAIGVKVAIKALAQANVIAAGGQEDGAPMIWSGGMAWIADFPDPSNFYGPILGCAGAVPGGWNWSWYCNKAIDDQAIEADSMAAPEQKEARIEKWKKIFTTIQDDEPWVPLFNENRFVLHSARVKASDAILTDPVYLVNYTNLDLAEGK